MPSLSSPEESSEGLPIPYTYKVGVDTFKPRPTVSPLLDVLGDVVRHSWRDT